MLRTTLHVLLSMLLSAAVAGGQANGTPPGKRASAFRVAEDVIRVDGHLDESSWEQLLRDQDVVLAAGAPVRIEPNDQRRARRGAETRREERHRWARASRGVNREEARNTSLLIRVACVPGATLDP
jgi:hypothetical protein